jgi:hypothetical protein
MLAGKGVRLIALWALLWLLACRTMVMCPPGATGEAVTVQAVLCWSGQSLTHQHPLPLQCFFESVTTSDTHWAPVTPWWPAWQVGLARTWQPPSHGMNPATPFTCVK